MENREREYMFLTEEDAREIISNQIDVQEQLRSQGQQTVRLVIAAIAAVGISSSLSLISIDYIPDNKEIQAAATRLPTTAQNIRGTLSWNTIIAIFAITIAILLFLAFFGRNYRAAQHTSLSPSLGTKDNKTIVISEKNGKKRMRQYESWVLENNQALAKKRENLNNAGTNLFYTFFLALLVLIIYVSLRDANIVSLLLVDIIFAIMSLSLLSVNTLIALEYVLNSEYLGEKWNMKEIFPYVNTVEYVAMNIVFIFITFFDIYVLQHYIRRSLPHLWELIRNIV